MTLSLAKKYNSNFAIKKQAQSSQQFIILNCCKRNKNIYLRLTNKENRKPFQKVLKKFLINAKKKPMNFMHAILPEGMSPDRKNIQRQAFAGLLWSKQYYHFDVERWLNTSDGITPVT